MKLHESNDFLDLIKLTAQHFSLLEVYIEKDYWVTNILKRLSQSEKKENVVFKGGTSLSKGYNAIFRFSEDIDLQLIDCQELSGDKLKKLLKKIEEELTVDLQKLPNHPREKKSGNIRKTIYKYDRTKLGEDFGQASKDLVLEINSMSIPEPFEKKKIKSYIQEYLEFIDMEEEAKNFELETFEINVLDIKRTFVEKIFAIGDFIFEENPVEELSKKVRHIYDIYMIYNYQGVKEFFNSEEFYEMANKVVVQNDFFGKRKNIDYSKIILKNREMKILDKVKRTYETEFKKMVFKELPKYEDIQNLIFEIFNKLDYWEKKYRVRENNE